MSASQRAALLARVQIATRKALKPALRPTAMPAQTDAGDDEDEWEPPTQTAQKRDRLAVLAKLAALGLVIGALVSKHGRGAIGKRDYDRQVGAALDGATEHALTTARQQFGQEAPSEAEVAQWSDPMAERLAALAARLERGEISPDQAQVWAAYVVNTIWHAYQRERTDSAKARGLIRARWVLDPAVKQHCAACLNYADGSPYAIADLPATPGDGSTDCADGCHCDLEYLGEDD